MPEGGEATAQAFYEGLLGLRRVPKPPHLEQRGGCWFENESVKIHLGVDADFRPARSVEHVGADVGHSDLVGVIAPQDQPVLSRAVYGDAPDALGLIAAGADALFGGVRFEHLEKLCDAIEELRSTWIDAEPG